LRRPCNGFLKSAAGGDAAEMEMSSQTPNINTQRPNLPPGGCRWKRALTLWGLIWVFSLLPVTLVFAQAPTNTIPALAPAYGEIPPTFWEQHEKTILIGPPVFIFIASLVCGIVALVSYRKPVVASPLTVARQSLEKLQRAPEDGKVLSAVSQILRRYLSTALQFPPGELTTAEFSAALAGNPKIGAEQAQAISSFLHECDQKKFSPRAPQSKLNAAARALQLIAETQKFLVAPGSTTGTPTPS